MALDIPLLPPSYKSPLGIYGEFFVLSRPGVSGLFLSPEAGKVEGLRGTIFVTTIRLCFVPDIIGIGGARPFDIPLSGIMKEEFKQPFFGANYLTGLVTPVPNRGLVNNITFRFTFNEGGCQRFLRVFFTLMAQYRIPSTTSNVFFEPPRLQSWVQEEVALRDPSDPSVIYLSQPEIPQQTRAQYTPVPTSVADEHVSYQSIADEETARNSQQQQQQLQQRDSFAPMPVSTSTTPGGNWRLPSRFIF